MCEERKILKTGTGEYLRYLGTSSNTFQSCLTTDRERAYPYTPAQVESIKHYFLIQYNQVLTEEDWIIINAKFSN